MNRLNRKLEYALMSLQYLADVPEGQKVSAKDVCDHTGSPFDATARVMQVMAQKGLLKSEQGVKGGYILSKDLKSVTFLELMEMILGPLELAKCIGDPSACEIVGKCNILRPINQLNAQLKMFYQRLSLADILKSQNHVHQQDQEQVGSNV